jgi:hypothetical protein
MPTENTILRRAVDALAGRLPEGWELACDKEMPRDDGRADALIRVRAPDGQEAALIAEVKRRLDPRRALALAIEVQRRAGDRAVIAVAPWMSADTRSVLSAARVNTLDLTGGVRLALSAPGLFIEAPGAARDPWPEASRVTLRGSKAARVVRALCAARPPLGVRELAAAAGTTPGYVSKLLGMLDAEAAVSRTEAGRVGAVDVRRLLERWAEDAPLEARATATTWIAPRGLTDLLERLRGVGDRYAITGSLAASRRAPVAAPRLVSVYMDDPDAFASAAQLRPADAGANVRLLEPDDDGPFDGAWEDEGVWYAALPQVVADLLTGPGRGPAEAEALLAWMAERGGVG